MAKKSSSASTGAGLIKAGGDKNAYLGHFRSPEVLKRGHNQGAPPLSTLDTNMAGGGSAGVSGAPRRRGSAPAGASSVSSGLTATPVPSGKMPGMLQAGGPSAANRVTPGGTASAMQAPVTAERGSSRADKAAAAMTGGTASPPAIGATRIAAMNQARTGLKTALGRVRGARQQLSDVVRGGSMRAKKTKAAGKGSY